MSGLTTALRASDVCGVVCVCVCVGRGGVAPVNYQILFYLVKSFSFS